MGFKFEGLPCESDAAGNVVRPWAIDGEVIYKMSMDNFLDNVGDEIQPEINTLIEKIKEKTGVLLSPDELSLAIREKHIDNV